jgi:glycosyltransferase involved in cell wall biosynthesis
VSRVDVHVAKTWPNREYASLKKALVASRPDVVFVPTAQTIDCGLPVVSMIRNMEPLLVPFDGNPWSEGVRNLARSLAARRAVERSERVIAVSRHVCDFLVSRWRIDPGKIGVVYHGVDRVAASRLPEAAADVDAGSFLFTAGSIRPARGLDDLVDALSQVPHTLLIAGEPDRSTRHYAAKIRRRTERLGSGARTVWLGRLDAAEMSWCFANCRAFVMTSRAEACPNTVLEAMAHGCLSVSTDRAPMPEFFGDAAIYYRAGDGRDLAARLAALGTISGRDVTALRERAFARARQFTWEATASQTVTQLALAIA